MGRSNAAAALASLGHIGRRYGPGLGTRKLALLATLSRFRLSNAGQVRRLHELLSFLDAYPDDRRVRARVRAMLDSFHRRPDLRRNRASLAGSGIAGTETPYRFYWPTALWISQVWPGALRIDREDPEHAQAILDALPQLLAPPQAELIRRLQQPTLVVLDQVRPRGLTDADFFISLIAAMPGDDFSREAFFDRIDPPFILEPGRSTPERTTARFDRLPLRAQRSALRGARPDLRQEARRHPRRVSRLAAAAAMELIRVARVSMITRERDLAAFQYADPRDAFLVDDGEGLAFALVGMLPERRLLLPAVYGGLSLHNGVPIGYVQLDLLGRHAELSFNQFETFRDGGAARVFARLVAMTHHMFGCDQFSIEPYQLGHGNEEGIESGAWWFYQRFGFRPQALQARRIAARELERIAKNRRYRSSPRSLQALARSHVFFSLDPARNASLPRTTEVMAAAARELKRFAQRDASARMAAATEAARTWLGASKLRPQAFRMLSRWAGVVLALSRRGRWSRQERKKLLLLIEVKAGSSERDYQRLLMRHDRIRDALGC